MQDVLPIVVVAVVLVFGVVGVALVVFGRGTYDRIGASGMTFDHPDDGPDADSTRDAEIAAMLEHSNAWRAAHGQPELTLADLDPEAAGTDVAPPADPGLRDEVRTVVEALNARRIARGLEPLDVDAEVERRLSG